MKPLSLIQLCRMAGGELLGGAGERHAVRVCTDSRQVQPGDLFVALKGEKFDGHEHVQEAAQAGAVAAMISDARAGAESKSSFGLIGVEDTLLGLQRLAAAYRRELSMRVVAVTGSNGKTSTKELIAAVLAKKFKTHKTSGNLNNHIGVPLTLLQAEPEHEWAVVEMGMNHPGELAPLMEMAGAEWGVITKIGWAHIEAFANQEAIALEKASVIRPLAKTGKAFLNADDTFHSVLLGQTEAEIHSVGTADSCTLKLELEELSEEGARFLFRGYGVEAQAKLKAPAWHMVQNAGLALAVGLAAGVPVKDCVEGLESWDAGGNRLSLIRWEQGYVVNDTYNASPDSMRAALETLQKLPVGGRRVALLGSMGELGSHAGALHWETGRAVVECGFELLYALGPGAEDLCAGAREAGMRDLQALAFPSHEELYNFYKSTRLAGDVILVKGSRSQRMERVVDMLLGGQKPC
ncbi:MAG: UDP-N-acetylmuramoyl-tripeptide--D-alanyl-D-alanine ligase [Blastochloris sp.]|nr:UDP-N-acetylmuramoyl-tripeptide--D-alanyl-D-alanine ligase [Blastochloris sp.]